MSEEIEGLQTGKKGTQEYKVETLKRSLSVNESNKFFFSSGSIQWYKPVVCKPVVVFNPRETSFVSTLPFNIKPSIRVLCDPTQTIWLWSFPTVSYVSRTYSVNDDIVHLGLGRLKEILWNILSLIFWNYAYV